LSYKQTFLEHFRKLLDSEYTLNEVAQKSGLSSASLSRYLSEKTDIGLSKLDTLEDALDLQPGYFLNVCSENQDKVPHFSCLEDAVRFQDNSKGGSTDTSLVKEVISGSQQPIATCEIFSDNMEPLITRGDTILLARPTKKEEDLYQGVYCLRVGNGIVLGRPISDGENLTVIMENKKYPAMTLPLEKCYVIYRVVGLIRKI